MPSLHVQHTRPSLAVIRWLTNPGRDVSAEVGGVLYGALLTSPGPIATAALNGLIIDIAALFLHNRPVFYLFAFLEIGLGLGRVAIVRSVLRARKRDEPTSLQLAILMTIAWCALEGTTAFVIMQTGNASLQVLCAAMTMAIIGPLYSRYYPAPRLTLLLICLCDLPFVAGACLSGQPWLLITAPMTPPFLYASFKITMDFQKLFVDSMTSQMLSEDRARHDPLTGLLNRAAFDETSRLRARADDPRFAVLCLDLDGFKSINDSLGHHAGDQLLTAVARRLEASVRGGDTIFRLGGDEFVIFARNMRTEAMATFADRVIERVTAQPYQFDRMPPIHIGVSIGSACCPEDGTDIDDLHRKADIALYASKAVGKGVHRQFQRNMHQKGSAQTSDADHLVQIAVGA